MKGKYDISQSVSVSSPKGKLKPFSKARYNFFPLLR